jgi:hypothetical protein
MQLGDQQAFGRRIILLDPDTSDPGRPLDSAILPPACCLRQSALICTMSYDGKGSTGAVVFSRARFAFPEACYTIKAPVIRMPT